MLHFKFKKIKLIWGSFQQVLNCSFFKAFLIDFLNNYAMGPFITRIVQSYRESLLSYRSLSIWTIREREERNLPLDFFSTCSGCNVFISSEVRFRVLCECCVIAVKRAGPAPEQGSLTWEVISHVTALVNGGKDTPKHVVRRQVWYIYVRERHDLMFSHVLTRAQYVPD